MIVWLLLVIFLFLLKRIMGNLKEKNKQKYFLIISSISVALIMGLRYPEYKTIGDLKIYYNFYDIMKITPWSKIFSIHTGFEPGYVILNKLFSVIVPWPQFIIIFEAAFCMFCLSKFIYSNSDYPFQAIILYITMGTMTFQLTGFRQSFAMGICWLSIELIKKKKLIPFFLLILLAMSFHKTALAFIPLYFIGNLKLRWINNLASFSIFSISAFLPKILTNVGNKLLDKSYGGYIGSRFGGLVPIIVFVIVIILSLIYLRKNQNNILLNMTIIGLAFYIMRYATLEFERIAFYFSIATIVQLPNMINTIKDAKTKNILNFMSMLFAGAYYIYSLSHLQSASYKFFWQ